MLWSYQLSPWFIFRRFAEPKGFACRNALTPSQAEHPIRTTTRTAASASKPAGGGTWEPPSPRLGADGAFSSDLEFLLSALKSRKEEARRYFHPPAVLNREEKPARARRFVPLIANTTGSGTPRSSLHHAGPGAIYLCARESERKMQSKSTGAPESREGRFAQHSEDEEQSQAAARSPEHPRRRSPILFRTGISQSPSGCLCGLSCCSRSFRFTLLSLSLPDPLHQELEAMYTTLESCGMLSPGTSNWAQPQRAGVSGIAPLLPSHS